MKSAILFTTLMIALQSASLAQYKSNGYVSFEQYGMIDSTHMFKHPILNTWLYTYTEKANGKPVKLLNFNAMDSTEYLIVDSLYLKQLDIKTPQMLFDHKNDIGWDFDKNGNLKTGPFRRLYVVEKLGINKFKIIMVVPLIGTMD